MLVANTFIRGARSADAAFCYLHCLLSLFMHDLHSQHNRVFVRLFVLCFKMSRKDNIKLSKITINNRVMLKLTNVWTFWFQISISYCSVNYNSLCQNYSNFHIKLLPLLRQSLLFQFLRLVICLSSACTLAWLQITKLVLASM